MFNNAKLFKMNSNIDWKYLTAIFPVVFVILLGIISISCLFLAIFATCLKKKFKPNCHKCDKIEEVKVVKQKENKHDQDND